MSKVTEARTKTLTRDEYRRKLIGTAIPLKRILVEAYGVEMELRQQTLDAVLGSALGATTKEQVSRSVVQMAFIPGTDVAIFEEGDLPQILAWPFGPDYMRIQNAISELMGVDIEKEEAALKNDPLPKSS